MARIQILELPSEEVGGVYRTPFALIIDQVETDTTEIRGYPETVIRTTTATELTQAEADTIARNVGAVGAILTACTLEIG